LGGAKTVASARCRRQARRPAADTRCRSSDCDRGPRRCASAGAQRLQGGDGGRRRHARDRGGSSMSIGQATRRVEGPRKVTGAARYAADNYPDDTLHAVMVGSPIAAGRVTAIDAARASAVPGVVRVLTHSDVPKLPKLEMPAAITHMPLQSDEVRWEGQAVALVVAETLEAAEEAAALVRVSITPTTALIPGKGHLESPPESGFWTVKGTKGDPQHGFAAAAARIEQSYFQPTRNH